MTRCQRPVASSPQMSGRVQKICKLEGGSFVLLHSYKVLFTRMVFNSIVRIYKAEIQNSGRTFDTYTFLGICTSASKARLTTSFIADPVRYDVRVRCSDGKLCKT
ncbi:hypothetical protein DAPPUDRAFT_228180 [Daphnia pulex]|uniref:Uncharacterized protein n=1 Tax=Daphnia pulex TaxID=6669 RepID=E9HBU0_DAPPU|nr:hypothetical protein DAPPUDRAFT_228180 [Daphnia pulex]|eukprot:EFX70813.1 hypothetical protein DAPPUDRAFT_228180 [Daphnia pulex]